VSFRGQRPVRVRGTRATTGEQLRSPWGVWLVATAAFMAFAAVARNGEGIAKAYVWTLLVCVGGGLLLVVISKASEGLLELVYFFRKWRWVFSDDPLDRWMVVIFAVLVEGMALLEFVVNPAYPKRVWVW
jgi:hypothetical protein